jgi:tryptophanyl-tRNA synthetase
MEQACEIIAKFNRVYQTDVLIEPQTYLSKTARLMGIDGKAKASKSLGNAILLADDQAEIRQKVFAMYTDPDHLKVSDPGKVQGNVVFDYLDAFCTDKEKVAELKAHYQKGGLGDTAIKGVLNEVLQTLLEPIRQRRQNLQQDYLRDILIEGGKAAKVRAAQTLTEVRSAMHINYFN